MSECERRRRSPPHSTVDRLCLSVLPPAVHRFIFSQSEETTVLRLLVRATFGAVSGLVMFVGLAHSLPLSVDLKIAAGCVFTGVCILCGAFSTSFRCSVLLMLPSILGSRGRTYLMVFILSVLYTGPLSNIEHNIRGVALSLSCNLDLQIQNSRLLWRDAIKPLSTIMEQLVDDNTDFEAESRSVPAKFQVIRDEVASRYGYERLSGNSTQERFTSRTMMQCDSVVDGGIKRCSDWFITKWEECMKTIAVPVINHIFCVPMTFYFLCDVMRVMTPWCREQIPVEGNFGQLYDQLDGAVDMLSGEFSSQLLVEEQQQRSVLGGAVLDQEFSVSVSRSFQKLSSVMAQILDLLQLLLSFTFISIFSRAVSYDREYRKDIRFDNVYVTTHFRQIDARRKREGKRCVLPLRRPEKKKLIDPRRLRIHLDEFREVIVSRHTYSQFNLSSGHDVDIRVEGDSMMSHLLKKTITAFNSSSHLKVHTDNRACVTRPSSLSLDVYVTCGCCVLLVALFTLLQVYTNRLRRVIAMFYHPLREKKRIIYLYNLQLQKRIYCIDKKCITKHERSKRTVFQRLTSWGRQLCCKNKRPKKESDSETHYSPG
ncbi:E3 ubiquitin-protein ligase DCST1 isoform X2 [Cynoglossus semilaevis]|uniref:E3 ubiquitin-protein ligase DCST1 isoform X2 n=1 Tax=Cynoglossus semilaevis TaxID=244447 RepID=UPI0007DCB346|nr:E3 ubiquitin-protein ligase DCST1 isoform X2 [Cynoglossus semilaevis]